MISRWHALTICRSEMLAPFRPPTAVCTLYSATVYYGTEALFVLNSVRPPAAWQVGMMRLDGSGSW